MNDVLGMKATQSAPTGDSLEAADLLRILFEVCEVQQPLHEGWQFPTATPSAVVWSELIA